MLKSPLFWKVSTLIGCMVLLLVPLMLVSSLVADRASYRDDVEDSLRQSTSGPQKLIGPLIAVPASEVYTRIEDNKEVKRQRNFILYWLPESLLINGKQQVESRQIGIYDGQIWHNALQLDAQFDRSKFEAMKSDNVTLGEPYMVIAVGDARGIGTVGSPTLNGVAVTVEPGSGVGGDLPGLHIPLAESALKARALTLSMTLNLNGTGGFSVVPVGRNSTLSLTSNWPHPGFLGDFLPESRDISDKGFSARWQSSWFANDMAGRFNDGLERVEWRALPAFSVSVATPADQYQLTDRAIKYAILLITLTFMAFFVFETLTGLRLHPMQYLLVGLSLVMFYLVLLALSEHIGFTCAWAVASLTGALINGVYFHAVLQGWRNSLLFTGALLGLDGVMWVLLRSEDSALLLGTGVLLLALCTVMFLTRHFDWYSLSQPKEKVKARCETEDELRVWK
ncbi:MAG: cell envelope integrity protein CreD [Yokenella regensburgei]|nr:cell envelope integrity protein CreD [Yokenella regensburgei]